MPKRNWLRDLRKSHGLTQKQVAKELGISTSYYTQLETHKMFLHLRLNQAVKLAEIFNVDVNEITRLDQELWN